MWKLTGVDPDSKYVIQLCHSDVGERTFRLRNLTKTESKHCDSVFETEEVSHDLLLSRNMRRISNEVKLSSGGSFTVDPHNLWLTLEEVKQLEKDDCDFGEVNWSTPTPPIFAPY